MKEPRPYLVTLILASFLLTGFLFLCALPVSYPRETLHHVVLGTSHIGDPETREEIHFTQEQDTEDLITHFWGEQISHVPGGFSLSGER